MCVVKHALLLKEARNCFFVVFAFSQFRNNNKEDRRVVYLQKLEILLERPKPTSFLPRNSDGQEPSCPRVALDAKLDRRTK